MNEHKVIKVLSDIKSQRLLEIEEGRHAMTYPPLYVVYDQIYTLSDPDDDYDQSTTLFDDEDEYVRFSTYDGSSCIPAEKDNSNWYSRVNLPDETDPNEMIKYNSVVKKSYHDQFITVCFTRKAAEDFIKYEGHNLKNPRIYVQYIHRRNIELKQIGIILGDK